LSGECKDIVTSDERRWLTRSRRRLPCPGAWCKSNSNNLRRQSMAKKTAGTFPQAKINLEEKESEA
jgi:hypothetical protein